MHSAARLLAGTRKNLSTSDEEAMNLIWQKLPAEEAAKIKVRYRAKPACPGERLIS
jgi:hypothetical protein